MMLITVTTDSINLSIFWAVCTAEIRILIKLNAYKKIVINQVKLTFVEMSDIL